AFHRLRQSRRCCPCRSIVRRDASWRTTSAWGTCAVAGTSGQRSHGRQSGRRDFISRAGEALRLVNQSFLARFPAIDGDLPTSAAFASTRREGQVAPARSAITAVGGGFGVRIRRSEPFNTCLYEALGSWPRGLATHSSGVSPAAGIYACSKWDCMPTFGGL